MVTLDTAFKVKDSGNRRHFNTGSQRDTVEGKTRVDLVSSPFVLERLGHHSRKGAEKYDEWNWAKGQPNSVYIASAMRHLSSFSGGMIDEDHLAAAIWNLMGIMHNQESVNRNAFLCLLNEEPIAPNKDLLDFPVFAEREEALKLLPEAPCEHDYKLQGRTHPGFDYYKCLKCGEGLDTREQSIEEAQKALSGTTCKHSLVFHSKNLNGDSLYSCVICKKFVNEEAFKEWLWKKELSTTPEAAKNTLSEAPECKHDFEYIVGGLGGQKLYQCSICLDVYTEADLIKDGWM